MTGTVVEDNLAGLSVNGLFTTISGGVFRVSGVPIGEGETVLTATARDLAGNIGETSITVRRGSPGPPLLTMDSPALAADSCFAGGLTHTFAGAYSSAKPASAPLLLDILNSDGTGASIVPAFSTDGSSWTVDGVSLGDGDGMAVATVTANDSDGQRTVVSRSFRIDGAPPVLTLTLDGAPLPGAGVGETPPAAAEAVLFGRAIAIRATVADGPLGAPPAPIMTLDGVPYVAGATIGAEGEHLLVATVTDCAGNTATAHALFAIDQTAPLLLSTDPEDGGLLPAGVGTISGTADSVISTATVNGVAATVNENSFTLAPFDWREGENLLEIVLTDAAGNSATFERRFTINSIEPTVEILIGGLPIPGAAIFTRGVTPEARSNDPDATVTATLDGSGFVIGTFIDTSGVHTIEATAVDVLGRTATAQATFEIDLSGGPGITITSPVDGAVLTEAVATVTGTVEGRNPAVTVNGIAASIEGGTWTVNDLPLDADVLNIISAGVQDAAGRSTGVSISVMVDTGNPQVLILEPVEGFVTNRRLVDVTGVVIGGPKRTSDGTVAVNGMSVVVTLDGSFRANDIPLDAGANTISAVAEDPQGRVGQDAVTVFSDLDPPLVRVLADGQPLEEGAAYGNAVLVRIEVEDESAEPPPPEIRLNGAPVAAAGPVVEFSVEESGGYVVAVTAADAAGNQRRTERSFSITGGGCVVSDLEPSSGSIVSETSVTIRGRSSNADSVTVRVPDGGDPPSYQEFQTQLADDTFVAGDVPLPSVGDNAIEVVCADAVGGEQVTELLVHRLEDGDGPTVEIESPDDGAWLTERAYRRHGHGLGRRGGCDRQRRWCSSHRHGRRNRRVQCFAAAGRRPECARSPGSRRCRPQRKRPRRRVARYQGARAADHHPGEQQLVGTGVGRGRRGRRDRRDRPAHRAESRVVDSFDRRGRGDCNCRHRDRCLLCARGAPGR